MNDAEKETVAIHLAAQMILGAAKAAGPMGAPSGPIYAAMMTEGMRLEPYLAIVDMLTRHGYITVKYDCIHFVKDLV